MARAREAMAEPAWWLGPMMRQGGSPVTAVVGEAPWARGASLRASHCESEVGGESRGFSKDAKECVADGPVVALVATNRPGGLDRCGAPMDAHGVDGVDERVVLDLGAAVGHARLGAPANGQPGKIEDDEDVGAAHGRGKAPLADISVEARDVEDLGQVGSDLEYVQGNDAVERDRARGEGVAGVARQVGELLAQNARAGNVVEGRDVRGGEGGGREGAEEGLHAGVAELAVGEAKLGAGVVEGGG
eukprot:TRINITY_DN7312_c0_g1_i2.p2 TRINITY_DN7312_c0_g1~~TRINITY_DN7312_c0_g1_i2.p2  ORF type:complete len:246 (-),score=8.36 TRINITY_DN7312_c0_g1_i2:682-1419(-)